jgi:gliding motility associated protien GldN
MKSPKIFVLVIFALLIRSTSDAQTQTVLDGAYVKEHNPTRKVIAYPYLREADVMWTRRVWQNIDIKQKVNQKLYFPITPIANRKSLFEVIQMGLLEQGSIMAYSPDSDEFLIPYSQKEVDSLLNEKQVKPTMDVNTGETRDTTVIVKMTPDRIEGYRIKEDWIFDKQRSERYIRIIGIAPLRRKFSESGEDRGVVPMFWLHYPECRYLFNNYDVYNTHNVAQEMTFDQLFQMRFFSSYIIKEDNVFDRSIQDYALGVDRLIESERIKNEFFEIEHDLWHY